MGKGEEFFFQPVDEPKKEKNTQWRGWMKWLEEVDERIHPDFSWSYGDEEEKRGCYGVKVV